MADDMTITAFPVALQDAAYLYDGTLEGLLSAVFLAYERHEEPLDIVRNEVYEPRLGQSAIYVSTDFARAGRVRRGVCKAAGRTAFMSIMHASTCEDYDMGAIVYRFIRHVMSRPQQMRSIPVLDDRANPVVADLRRLALRASNESENMRQFVRFSKLENGVWFSQVSPNASVVPLVMGYFASRLNDQPFIIYDERHKIAGVYDGRTWQLVKAEEVNVGDVACGDELMEEAWKRFYDALSVDARYNPELRRHFMPVRLWKDLPEMKPRKSLA